MVQAKVGERVSNGLLEHEFATTVYTPRRMLGAGRGGACGHPKGGGGYADVRHPRQVDRARGP